MGMTEREITIAFSTDQFYLIQTCIAIESVLQAAENKERHYSVYVLMPVAEVNEAETYFEKIQTEYDFCTIFGIGVAGRFQDSMIQIAHLTKPSLYRLLLPELLKQNKCIYLDSDVIVCSDLAELYDLDISDYDMGGVLAPSYVLNGSYADKIGIPDTKGYINSGVLLMNLKRLRKKHFVEQAVSLSKQSFEALDQDIINRISYGRLKRLSLKYNMPPAVQSFPDSISAEEIREARENPVILHYAYPEKPWEYPEIDMAARWWLSCSHSLFFEEMLNQYKNSLFYYSVIQKLPLWTMTKYSEEWFKELRTYKKCYIYGAGKKGERAAVLLKRHDVKITAILVSNKEGNRKAVCGIPVEEFSEKTEKDALILVAVARSAQYQIRRKLFQYKIFGVMPLYDI